MPGPSGPSAKGTHENCLSTNTKKQTGKEKPQFYLVPLAHLKRVYSDQTPVLSHEITVTQTHNDTNRQ